jgi:hypothetical protein
MSVAWNPENEMFRHAESRGEKVVPVQTPVGDPLATIRGILFALIFSLPFWLIVAIAVLHFCGGTR